MHRRYLLPRDEALVADFFKLTAIRETQVEDARQVVCSSSFFSPGAVFSFLDRYGVGRLSPHDLQSFLQSHYVSCTLAEASSIIEEYDENGDGRLSFREFERFCLSSESDQLQWKAKSRHYADSMSRRGGLDYYVERDFLQLLRAELIYQRDTSSSIPSKSFHNNY